MVRAFTRGWRPDPLDNRDLLLRSFLTPESVGARPVSVNMLPSLPAVLDQGPLGSCTGCALDTLYSHFRSTEPRSRLQIYYSERLMEGGPVEIDDGAAIRTGMKVLQKVGAASEAIWPYFVHRYATQPPAEVFADAAQHRIDGYVRLVDAEDFHDSLAMGHPFVAGFMVYEGFLSDLTDQSGLLLFPGSGEEELGGHAVVIAGYNDDFRRSAWAATAMRNGVAARDIPERVYLARNSYGYDWGRVGDFAIDAKYVENKSLFLDAWAIAG